jgi:IclR family pca regulon transcriptional regulator
MEGRSHNSKTKDPEFLSTLERGLQVMGVFGREQPEMSLSDVAAAAKLSPAVARRCLNTLVELGYIGRNGRRFLLLPKMLKFGDAFLASTNVEQAVMPALQNLRDETGDTIMMGVPVEHNVIGIAHVSTAKAIRPSGNIGTSFPLYSTSLGKAILAFLPQDELDEYMVTAQRPAITPNTKTDADVLLEDLAQIRKQGFATSDGEYDYGIYAIAVPIFGDERKVIGSINASTSKSRPDKQGYIEDRLPIMQETASHIEREIRKYPTLLRSLRG